MHRGRQTGLCADEELELAVGWTRATHNTHRELEKSFRGSGMVHANVGRLVEARPIKAH